MLGTGAALGLSRWIETLLFGVSMTSVSAFAPVVLLAAAALLACAVPALRAARVDPMEALRAD